MASSSAINVQNISKIVRTLVSSEWGKSSDNATIIEDLGIRSDWMRVDISMMSKMHRDLLPQVLELMHAYDKEGYKVVQTREKVFLDVSPYVYQNLIEPLKRKGVDSVGEVLKTGSLKRREGKELREIARRGGFDRENPNDPMVAHRKQEAEIAATERLVRLLEDDSLPLLHPGCLRTINQLIAQGADVGVALEEIGTDASKQAVAVALINAKSLDDFSPGMYR